MTYPGVADPRWELSASIGMSEPEDLRGEVTMQGTKMPEPQRLRKQSLEKVMRRAVKTSYEGGLIR